MINRVVLTGRLVANIELRQTNDGTPYAFFSLAVTRSSNRDKTDFISAVAWRNTAEFMSNYMRKGSLIGVEGRIESYTKEVDGHNQTTMNVNVSQVHFLESKADAERRHGGTSEVSFENETKIVKNSVPSTPQQESVFAPNPSEDKSSSVDDINFDDIKF